MRASRVRTGTDPNVLMLRSRTLAPNKPDVSLQQTSMPRTPAGVRVDLRHGTIVPGIARALRKFRTLKIRDLELTLIASSHIIARRPASLSRPRVSLVIPSRRARDWLDYAARA
jgi:hypothetical protein